MKIDPHWFNVSTPCWKVAGKYVTLFQVFNRRAQQAHWWGFGLLQIGKRHLLLIHHGGLRALFIGTSQ